MITQVFLMLCLFSCRKVRVIFCSKIQNMDGIISLCFIFDLTFCRLDLSHFSKGWRLLYLKWFLSWKISVIMFYQFWVKRVEFTLHVCFSVDRALIENLSLFPRFKIGTSFVNFNSQGKLQYWNDLSHIRHNNGFINNAWIQLVSRSCISVQSVSTVIISISRHVAH